MWYIFGYVSVCISLLGRKFSAEMSICIGNSVHIHLDIEYLYSFFIFARLQRTNKEGTSGGGLRYSPVHADHSVLAPTPIHPRHHALQHANGMDYLSEPSCFMKIIGGPFTVPV